MAFRLYRAWDDGNARMPLEGTGGRAAGEPINPVIFLQNNVVECLGMLQGFLIAHYVRKPRDSYPWTFYTAFIIAIIEIIAFYRLAIKPEYTFHVDATLPVGAIYFIFVWGSDAMMNRSLLDAKLGIEASRRLSEHVSGGGEGGRKND